MKFHKYRVVQYVPAEWYYPEKLVWYWPFWRRLDHFGHPTLPMARADCVYDARPKTWFRTKAVHPITDI